MNYNSFGSLSNRYSSPSGGGKGKKLLTVSALIVVFCAFVASVVGLHAWVYSSYYAWFAQPFLDLPNLPFLAWFALAFLFGRIGRSGNDDEFSVEAIVWLYLYPILLWLFGCLFHALFFWNV